MEIVIFRLSDHSDYLDGDREALGRYQHLSGLTEDQFDFLVELVGASAEHDWR